mmetsp:Transcript_40449/g.74904  ORF Transcript_40449/g.74904 Transcript_40449/m.74904 type:complete len:782 (-) Transcript_40449:164-2509(-)
MRVIMSHPPHHNAGSFRGAGAGGGRGLGGGGGLGGGDRDGGECGGGANSITDFLVSAAGESDDEAKTENRQMSQPAAAFPRNGEREQEHAGKTGQAAAPAPHDLFAPAQPPAARKRPRALTLTEQQQQPQRMRHPLCNHHDRDCSCGRIDASVLSDEVDRWLGEVCEDQQQEEEDPRQHRGNARGAATRHPAQQDQLAAMDEHGESMYAFDASVPLSPAAAGGWKRSASSSASFSSRVAGIRRRRDESAVSRGNGAFDSVSAAATSHDKSDSLSSSSSNGVIKDLLRREMGSSLGLGTVNSIEPIPFGGRQPQRMGEADNDLYQPTPLAAQEEAMIRRQQQQQESEEATASSLSPLTFRKPSPQRPQHEQLAFSYNNTAPAPPPFAAGDEGAKKYSARPNYEPIPFSKSPKISGFASKSSYAQGLDDAAEAGLGKSYSQADRGADARQEGKEQPPTPQPQDSDFVAQYYATVMGGPPTAPTATAALAGGSMYQKQASMPPPPPLVPPQPMGQTNMPSSLLEAVGQQDQLQDPTKTQVLHGAATASHPLSEPYLPTRPDAHRPPQHATHPPGAGSDIYAPYLQAADSSSSGKKGVCALPAQPLRPLLPPEAAAAAPHPSHIPQPPPPPPLHHPLPPPQPPAAPPKSLAVVTDEILAHLQDFMEQSQDSQQAIHDWDRAMGLRRSHSKTMRHSSRSRKKLRAMREKMLECRGGATAAVPPPVGWMPHPVGLPVMPPTPYGVAGPPGVPLPPSLLHPPPPGVPVEGVQLTPYQLYLREHRAKTA